MRHENSSVFPSTVRSTAPLQHDAIYLLGVGAQTPIGRTSLSSAAAVRSGISTYAEHPFMLDKRGERVVVARASWLDDGLHLEERLHTLSVDAAREALQGIARARPRFKLRLHLILSTECLQFHERARHTAHSLAEVLSEDLLDEEPTTVVEGHAGGFLALEKAIQELRSGRASACLVGDRSESATGESFSSWAAAPVAINTKPAASPGVKPQP